MTPRRKAIGREIKSRSPAFHTRMPEKNSKRTRVDLSNNVTAKQALGKRREQGKSKNNRYSLRKIIEGIIYRTDKPVVRWSQGSDERGVKKKGDHVLATEENLKLSN
jgi:hypothetical protein